METLTAYTTRYVKGYWRNQYDVVCLHILLAHIQVIKCRKISSEITSNLKLHYKNLDFEKSIHWKNNKILINSDWQIHMCTHQMILWKSIWEYILWQNGVLKLDPSTVLRKSSKKKKKSLKMLCIYKENKFCQNDQGYLLPLRVFNLNIHNMQGDDNL